MIVDTSAIAAVLAARLPSVPRVAVVLGSGLGGLVRALDDPVSVPFESLSGLPAAGVSGHEGRFVYGIFSGVPVLFQSGRYHLYEGHDIEVVAALPRILAELGVEVFVLTNAAGGIRRDLGPGDLVLVEDHIGLFSASPLIGPVRAGEPRFPDMSAPYDEALRAATRRAAEAAGVELREGVYAAVRGPQFETAAEIRALAALGADVVGMSTVPEVIAARARGMRCLAVSMVTNHATGLGAEPVSHEEVLEVGRSAGRRLAKILESLLRQLAEDVTPPTRSG